MQRIRRSLTLRIAVPLAILNVALGASLYLLVNTTVSGFVDDEIERDLKSLSHRIYNICNTNFDDILHSGLAGDQGALIIKQALTLGQFEDFFRQENMKGLVYEVNSRELLLEETTSPLSPEKIIAESKAEGKIISFMTKTEDFFSYHFTFSPWDWGIIIIKSKREYSDLITQVQHVHFYTLGLVIFATFLVVFFLYQSIKRPIDSIIKPIKKGRVPEYKGIDAFEFLSDTIAIGMNSLQESEENYRRLTENAKDMIYRQSLLDGKYEYVNQAAIEMTGYSPEEICSEPMHIRKTIHPDWKDYLEDQWKNLLKGKVSPFYEFQIIHKSGEVKWIHQRNVLIYDDGQPIATEGIATDITEHKKMQDRLRQSHKMESIGTLAGGIAHQFNNALYAITGNIDLLEDHFRDEEHAIYFTKEIRKSAHRLTQLTAQLLAFARGGKYHAKIISLSDFVKETIPLVKHAIDSSIQISIDLPRSIYIKADLAQMQMALSAVLFNASEAIDNAKGYIRIACQKKTITDETANDFHELNPGDYACLEITDNGRGMAEETRNRMFEPFFTTNFEGRGLGMAAAYGIIKNHDGSISVASELAKGTTVTICMPVVETDVIEDVKPSQPAKPKLSKGSGVILVIEDEKEIMKVTRLVLERLGYSVLEASTGREAIRIAENFDHEIALAMLDILMPDINGNEIYPHIKNARPGMKVLVFSGYSIDGPAQEILDAGAEGFIQKPFTMSALSEKLEKLLGYEQ